MKDTNWASKYKPTYEEQDFSQKVEEDYPTYLTKPMNWHSARTYGLLGIIGLVGVLQYLHGAGFYNGIVDVILPLALIAEHKLQGKTE